MRTWLLAVLLGLALVAPAAEAASVSWQLIPDDPEPCALFGLGLDLTGYSAGYGGTLAMGFAYACTLPGDAGEYAAPVSGTIQKWSSDLWLGSVAGMGPDGLWTIRLEIEAYDGDGRWSDNRGRTGRLRLVGRHP